jgi:transcriptional regulator with XRE-family HTH domain
MKKTEAHGMKTTLVDLALKALACSQKELAAKLKVSPSQITKWKKGEYMSSEMRDKLNAFAGIGELDSDFVVLAGTVEEAVKWDKLIHFLAAAACDEEETGYRTDILEDDLYMLDCQIFQILEEMGVSIPERFPAELELDYKSETDDLFDTIFQNPYAGLIYNIFLSLNNVYGFYTAYVEELMSNDELDLYETDAVNIESSLLRLAACKIDVSAELAPKFNEFKHSELEDFREWLTTVKHKTISAGVPLRAEIFDLINNSSDELRADAETESFGFNAVRLHPDIYMNELLTGMRAIQKALPFIMKKMGIYEEFQLDSSAFSVESKKEENDEE